MACAQFLEEKQEEFLKNKKKLQILTKTWPKKHKTEH